MKNSQAEIIGQKIWIKSGDETWAYDIADLSTEGRRRKSTATATPDQIRAPMPGKITKLFVTVGDAVRQGQALLVMEAMKMEYTLKSDLNTKVEKINVQLGQQVEVGTFLIQLQKTESP